MTDTNMTDTNYHHGNGGGVPQVVENACVLHGMRNSEQEKCMGPCVGLRVCCCWWCGFVVCCAVSDTTPVVLGVLVVIVAGSRPVVLFEPGC